MHLYKYLPTKKVKSLWHAQIIGKYIKLMKAKKYSSFVIFIIMAPCVMVHIKVQ